MKITITCTLVLLLGFGLPLNTHGQSEMPEANWDRSLAMTVVRQVDTKAVLTPLFEMVHTGSDSELLDALSSIEQDREMPNPAKDFLIYTFAVGLGDLDEDLVNPGVLHFLGGYEVKTRVSHIDHPRMNVPLFNVRAATVGVRNRWARQHAAMRAETLLQEHTAGWISAYLEAGHVERLGFIDAIDFASTRQLGQLGASALARLEEQPELTLVTVRAGILLRDIELLHQAILRGSGPDFSRALAAVSSELRDEEASDLLYEVLQVGSTDKAALAIAQLAPNRLGNPEMADMLFDTLADRHLGAAAALMLGRSLDPKIRTQLKEVASGGVGLSQKRARLAISTRHVELGTGQ